MKKLLILSAFLNISNILNAQARIGFTEQQIKEQFPELNYQTYYTENGLKYIAPEKYSYGRASIHYPDENGLSDKCLVIFANNLALNNYISNLNENYVSISDTEWRAYVED